MLFICKQIKPSVRNEIVINQIKVICYVESLNKSFTFDNTNEFKSNNP